MLRALIVLCLLPYTVLMGPLPRLAPYPYGEARMDEVGRAAASNENFLNAFLGNVQTNGADGDIKPLIEEASESTEVDEFIKDKDGKKPDDKDGYGEDDYSYNDVYDDYYEEDYDHDKKAHFDKASLKCHEFHWPHAITPLQCGNVKQQDIEPDYILDHKDFPNSKAYCRWHGGYGVKNPKCLCPRIKSKCYEKDQCYWYKPKSEKSKDEYGYEEDKDGKHHGQCIHNSERFYNILANLLSKRGKKDFALKIKYSSAASEGELPYGPWGPQIFDHYEEPYFHPHPYGGHGYGNHGDSYRNDYDYGYQNSPQYGYGYDAYDTMPYNTNGYGHGGYENIGGYQGYGSPNYHHAFGANQGYTNYGSPYDFQGQGYPQDVYQNVGGYSPGVNVNQVYPNNGMLYDSQEHVGYPTDIYQNGGGYSSGVSVNQGYTNYGTPYDSQGHGYQDIYQNVSAYSPVNNQPSYYGTSGPAIY